MHLKALVAAVAAVAVAVPFLAAQKTNRTAAAYASPDRMEGESFVTINAQ
jgi:hypothetical protein